VWYEVVRTQAAGVVNEIDDIDWMYGVCFGRIRGRLRYQFERQDSLQQRRQGRRREQEHRPERELRP
jgi:hypothetical protein